jgi:hypothetical protein
MLLPDDGLTAQRAYYVRVYIGSTCEPRTHPQTGKDLSKSRLFPNLSSPVSLVMGQNSQFLHIIKCVKDCSFPPETDYPGLPDLDVPLLTGSHLQSNPLPTSSPTMPHFVDRSLHIARNTIYFI